MEPSMVETFFTAMMGGIAGGFIVAVGFYFVFLEELPEEERE